MMAILTITLAIAVIALAVALIIKSKEHNDLLDKYSDAGKLICKLKNELNTLTVENVRLTGENRDYFVEKMKQNFYHEFHKFVLVSDELSNYMEQMPKRYEEDGYIYDKDKSFPTVLCFTKREPIPVVEEEKPNASEENPN